MHTNICTKLQKQNKNSILFMVLFAAVSASIPILNCTLELATLFKRDQSQAWAAVDLFIVIIFLTAHAFLQEVLICFMTSFFRCWRLLTIV